MSCPVVLRLAGLAAVCVTAIVVGPASASANTVFGSNGCGKSEYQPSVIVLACADAKLLLEDAEWTRWDDEAAVASGSLRHPDVTARVCANKPIFACPWVESDATVKLWRPVYCASNGRWQFTRLRIEAPEDIEPEVREQTRDFRCSEYDKPNPPRPPRAFLGTRYAAALMRRALGRRPALLFAAGYARRVQCNSRVARDRVRCSMSWFVGDSAFGGRGAIWVTYEGGNRYWNFSYRITRFNEYCAVMEAPDCTKTFIAR